MVISFSKYILTVKTYLLRLLLQQPNKHYGHGVLEILKINCCGSLSVKQLLEKWPLIFGLLWKWGASLGIFSADRPHGIHSFLSRNEPKKGCLWLGKTLGKWPPKFGLLGRRIRGKMRRESWKFFLQVGLTEFIVSWADMNREIIPLARKKCWKVAREIWILILISNSSSRALESIYTWNSVVLILMDGKIASVCFDFESGWALAICF